MTLAETPTPQLNGCEPALALLEFDPIRQQLAGYTRTLLGREYALALTPTADYPEIVRRQQETAEARRFIDAGGSGPALEFGPGADLREYAQRAGLGGLLRGGELNEIRQLAQAVGHNRSSLRRRADLPLLSALAANLPDLSGLERAIRDAVSPAGELLDDASPQLRQLRRASRDAYQQLNAVMQRSLRRYQQRAVVQEPIVTQRNNRLVLLIKTDFKSQAPGIVHDVSDSGATVFIEPLAAIEPGNLWRESRLAEEREEERVLRALTAQVEQRSAEVLLALDLLARLDLALAKGRYSADRRAVAPTIIPNPSNPLDRNPLPGHPELNPPLTRNPLPGHPESAASSAHPELVEGRANPLNRNSLPGQDEPNPPLTLNSLKGHPELVEGRAAAPLRLTAARHPLLAEPVVPLTLELGGDQRVMVITGPNAGGKTVALKTVGLLALMAHAGLHIPAAAAVFPLLEGIYADIGDQQSIEQSLSTFSSHIRNLQSILAQITPHSLALIDELGASTDPEEGTALAQAILDHFRQRGALAIATTHHRGVARYVQEQPGMINASVDLAPGTLEPTYRLTQGLPGRSYALTIADRLGLPADILETARSLVSPALTAADELIQELQAEREAVAQMRQESERLLAQARAQQAETEQRLAAVETARLELVEDARQELQQRIAALLEQLQQAERAVQQAQAAQQTAPPGRAADGADGVNADLATAADALQERQAALTQARREISAAHWQPIAVKRTPWPEKLQSGDRVYIRGIPRPVEVITPLDADEQIEVLLGTMRAKIPVYQLERPAAGLNQDEVPRDPARAADPAGSAAPPADPAAATGPRFRHNRDAGVYYRRPSPRQVKTDLDLRGQRVEPALDQLENLLDQAALSGAAQIRIIHGQGTGALRRAVREHLHGHPLVAHTGPAADQGSDGVTVVELK